MPPPGARITTGGAGGTTHALHMVEIKVVATVDETSHKEEREGGRVCQSPPASAPSGCTNHNGWGGGVIRRQVQAHDTGVYKETGS